jgi:hypothetical protein
MNRFTLPLVALYTARCALLHPCHHNAAAAAAAAAAGCAVLLLMLVCLRLRGSPAAACLTVITWTMC